MLEEEEQETKLNNLNTTNKKKSKGKRIPQRGLGVEKLEKLRMEEEQTYQTGTTLFNANPTPSIIQIPEFNSLAPSINFLRQTTGNAYPRFPLNNAEEIKHHPYWPVSRTNSKSVALEPPSNQNFMNNSSITSLNTDMGTISHYINQSEAIMLPRKSPFRVDFSCSSSDLYQSYSCKRKKEGSEDGGFLSLGSSTSTQSTLRSNSPMSTLPSRPFLHPQFSAFQNQGGGTNTLNQYANHPGHVFYSFLPMVPTVRENKENDQNDDVLDGVDTRLKL